MGGIDDWLAAVRLSKYVSLFSDHAIDLDVLATLTDDDLKQLGVPLGDRKRILKAVAASGEPDLPGHDSQTAKPVPDDDSDGTAAERRQVTVVFCDLVDSTDLAGRLDPEELADVMAAYQGCCEEVVGHWDGHLAEFLGDGAVVYFGWPTAHEDDAERAVYAALELTSSVDRLTAAGASLSARVGIATGVVVVGEIKNRLLTRREGAVGGTVNVAARLQGLAAPGSVAIALQTRRLVGHRFALESLGPQALKGVATPVEAWLVKGVLSAKSRFDARVGPRVSTLVGRERETATLLWRWEECVAGSGRASLITGEPGIGKSRLLQVLSESSGTRVPGTHIALQCSPYHLNTALQPFIGWLTRSIGITVETDPAVWADCIDTYVRDLQFAPQEAVPLISTLMSAPPDRRYAASPLSPQLQRDRTIRLIIDVIRRVARRGPVLMVVEDLQWSDPTTRELLACLIGELATIRVFLVMTARPEFDSGFAGGAVEQIALNRLPPLSMMTMIEELTGHKVLPQTVLASVLNSAGGVPLFVEELVRSLLESNTLRDVGDRFELTSGGPDLAVPATLHDLLVSRLDRLPSGKVVARVAATLGPSFSIGLLRHVLPSRVDRLQHDLRQLCEAGILELLSDDGDLAIYGFRHALLREAAYRSQLNSRRRRVHLTVATALEQHYPRVVQSEPEVLAHHYAEGGRAEVAAAYLLQAGRKALQTGATREAVTHLSTGLSLVHALPHSQLRHRAELRLQATLGTAYMQARGWAAPEVETAYLAAAALSDGAETAAEGIWILWGMWVYYQVRGRIDHALAASERIQTRAHADGSVESLVVADMIGLQVTMYAGRFPASLQHCEAFAGRYDAERHRGLTDQYSIDLELVRDVHESMVRWIVGQPDRAVALAQRALRLSFTLEHPYSIAWCCTWGQMVALLAGDTPHLSASLETGMAIAEDNGYAYVAAMGRTISGWIVGQGDAAAGAALMARGLTQFRATGAEIVSPFFETLQAELLVRHGLHAEALELLRQAKGQIDRWGERWQEAEVYRVEGNALSALHSGCPAAVEASYRRAMAISSQQGALAWHLRACTDFANTLGMAGRIADAMALLGPAMAAAKQTTEDVRKATLTWERLAHG